MDRGWLINGAHIHKVTAIQTVVSQRSIEHRQRSVTIPDIPDRSQMVAPDLSGAARDQELARPIERR